MTGDLDLPPGFDAVVLREHRDAHAHACAIAPERGAGTLVWVRRFDTVEAAIVLEPDEPLPGAWRALYAVMTALGDALSVHIPPEKPLTFVWPDTVLLDGGIVGGVRLSWPEDAADDKVPDWLVAGFQMRLAVPQTRPADGAHPLDIRLQRGTSLEIEGFEMMDGAGLISSFARHLMATFDLWREKGFQSVAQQYLARLDQDRTIRRGIDGNGDLLIRRLKSPVDIERQVLTRMLAEPQWLDPASGEPWL